MAGVHMALCVSLGLKLCQKVEQLKQLEARKSGLVAQAIRFGVSTMLLVLDVLQAYGQFRSLNIFPTTGSCFWERVSQKNGNCGL